MGEAMTIATAFTTDAELVATASADALQAGRLPEAPLAMPTQRVRPHPIGLVLRHWVQNPFGYWRTGH